MKKIATIIFSLLVAWAMLVVGGSVLSSTGTQSIQFDKQVKLADGVTDPETGEGIFMLDEGSDYELRLRWEASEPGLLSGIRIANETGDTLFACTGDSADIESASIYLPVGVYNLETHYLTNEEEFEEFCDLAGLEPEFVGKEVYEYAAQGQWNIHYELIIKDTRSNAMAFAVIGGIIVGLLLVVVMLVITKTDDKIKCNFDERQEVVRGKGFKYGFFTIMICNTLFAVLEMCEVSLFAELEVAMSLSIILGIIVFACYCIWKDGYFSLNENRKMLMICFIIIAVVNLGMGIGNFVQGQGFVNGRLTFRSINLFCGIMALIVLATIMCKQVKENKEE